GRDLPLDSAGRGRRRSGIARQRRGAAAPSTFRQEGRPGMNLPIRREIVELEDSKIVDVWHRGFDMPDAIMLAVGEGDLPTPKFIFHATYRSLTAGGTFYTYKRGIPELRGAVPRYHRSPCGECSAHETT